MPEDQREKILAQPSAMKEVYAPADHYVNGHVILRGSDGWHLFYHPMEPHPPSNRMLHATSPDLLTLDPAWAGAWRQGHRAIATPTR